MPRAISHLVIASFAFTALASTVAAQDTTWIATARIYGHVFDRGRAKALPGARLTLLALDRQATSDKDGHFSFQGIPAGTFVLRAELDGRATREDSVTVQQGQSLDVFVRLSPDAGEFPHFEIAQRYSGLEARGFYERREHVAGIFFSPQDLDRRNARQTSDIFQGLSGIVVKLEDGVSRVDFIRGVRCRPDIYVDNAPLGSNQTVDVLRPAEVAAIEIYFAGNMPPRYKSNLCGAIVFWTRRFGLS